MGGVPRIVTVMTQSVLNGILRAEVDTMEFICILGISCHVSLLSVPNQTIVQKRQGNDMQIDSKKPNPFYQNTIYSSQVTRPIHSLK